MADLVLLGRGSVAVDVDGSGSGEQQSGEHFNSGGFTGSIRAEKGKDLTFFDLKGGVVNGGETVELFSELADGDDRMVG